MPLTDATLHAMLRRQRAAMGEWRYRAACRGMDPNLFFPFPGESNKEAKAVCETCPVRSECRTYAFAAREKMGVWGGLSERERVRIRKAS